MAKTNKILVITIVVLLVLLLVAIGYIGYGRYTGMVVSQQNSAFQQGSQFGYEQAVGTMFQMTNACQQVPLTYNNQTINIVKLECFTS